MRLMNLGLVAALSAFVATAASAAVIVPIPGGPFSLTNHLAGLPAIDLALPNTYDFTFSMADPLANSVATIQIEAQGQKTGANEQIQFDFYAGTPGSGVFLATSSLGTNANLTFNPSPGPYYIEILPGYIASNKEAISGTILVSTVPEPASWATMILGVGAIGVSLRRRKALAKA